MSPGAISSRLSSQGRTGMVTRAANAHRHPGLLALDDEDLKAIKKKNEAALRRQAKAEEKKSSQARLQVNTQRIASFEDALSEQHANNLENAARPALVLGQMKAGRPKGQGVKPVSDASAQSIIHADPDCAPGDLNQESDASQADDIDYARVDSHPRASRILMATRRRPHQSGRQVESRTGDKYVASKDSITNTGKHKHGSESDPEEVQSGKRRKTNHSNTHRSRLVDGNSRHSATSPLAPLQNASRNVTTTSAGENDRFNLDYGGIMDEDVHEIAPLPIKPSQVKVTTKLEHDLPLVKVEALDPGLPGHRRGKVKERSSQACLNLDSRQLETWKKVLVPAFRSILGAQTNPWDNSNPQLLVELQYIYHLVFPDTPRKIEHNGPEYSIVCQRGCEWRARIAREVLQATEEFLLDTCGDAPTAIAEYVGHLLEGARYMWEENDAHTPLEYKGLFLAPYIVAGLRAHLEMTANLPEELRIVAPPQGALALATVAAERSLKAWETGSCTLGEDVSRKKEEVFSEARWGAATNAVIPSILRMSERKWTKVMERALEASSIAQQTPAPAFPMYAPDDARALAYEADSE